MSILKTKDGRKNLVGLKLIQLREGKGMSQRDLAKAFQLIGCDIDQNVITRIETGKRKVTDMEIWAISIVFGVKAGELFDSNAVDEVFVR
ncbi:MAG: helix-turn-helix transcriptional regulator [Lachnospiraceae bacterium]|nr:helix-turn-helix transcriptional regulator [Lachnospiraceae bacterium]